MTIIWIVVGIALLIVWVITIYDIFRRHLGGTKTVAWVLLALILPFIGAIAYWATRPPEPGEADYFAEADAQRRYEDQHRPFDSTRP